MNRGQFGIILSAGVHALAGAYLHRLFEFAVEGRAPSVGFIAACVAWIVTSAFVLTRQLAETEK